MIGYSDAVSALKLHELDIALVASQPRDEDLRAQLLMSDRLIAVMSPRHHLAGRDVIQIQELSGEPLIILTARSELRARVAAVFKRFHVPINVQVETDTLESIKNMVARDMGLGIVPRMCIKREEARGELVAKAIVEFGEERSLWLFCRRTAALAPACQAFIKAIQSELSRRPEEPDKADAQPTVFYRWQKEFFENGAAAFQTTERPRRQAEEKQKRIEFLEKKVQTKDEVLAELMAEHIALRKSLGEL